MADEIYISAVTGLTPTLQLYNGSTPVGSPFSATEIDATGEYVASVPGGTPYGAYLVIAEASPGVKIASGELYWDGTQEISPVMYEEMRRLEGLNPGSPMTVTPNSRVAGDINLQITGDGINSSTVTRV